MDFALPCPCGNVLRISAIDAGRKRRCPCGEEFQIPLLRELRHLEAAGETTLTAVRTRDLPRSLAPQPQVMFQHTTAQKLESLVQAGRLPLEKLCMQCNEPTQDVLHTLIECELPKPVPPELAQEGFFALLHALHSPLNGLLHLFFAFEEEPEMVGDTVVVRAPLRICSACSWQLVKSPETVKQLLQGLALYQPLFQEYPEAAIKISEQR